MAATPASADELVLVGTVARPHGLRGDVLVNPETDFVEERFAEGARLLLGRPGQSLEPVRVREMRMHKGRPLIAFESIDSIERAEQVSGAGLFIREADRPPLPPGTYYETELVGCGVETTTGAEVGRVVRVDAAGGAPVMAVEGESGEVLIPLAEAICRRIDPAARRITIDPPEGLLELNTPGRRRRGRRRPDGDED